MAGIKKMVPSTIFQAAQVLRPVHQLRQRRRGADKQNFLTFLRKFENFLRFLREGSPLLSKKIVFRKNPKNEIDGIENVIFQKDGK